MKKITLLLILTMFSINLNAQTYKYHRFQTFATIEDACVGDNSKAFQVKVNLDINRLLERNGFYLIDFGENSSLGQRYAKVLNRYDGRGDADFDLIGANVDSPIEVCNAKIRRYHNFQTFTSLQKAEDNSCGITTSHDGRYKVNISINRLLDKNKVYLINLGSSLGVRYCKTLNRYNGRGDADFAIDGDAIGSPVQISCIIDSDGDGTPDAQDNCPTVAGPSSNNGCPGNPDLTIPTNNVSISSGCSSCSSLLSSIGNSRYLANPSFQIFVSPNVKNQGTASSVASNVQYFLSSNSTYSGSDVPIGGQSNFSAISPSGDRSISSVSFDYGTISGIRGNSAGSAYILMVVDKANISDFNPNELNENNNVTAIPIRYSSSNSSSLTFDMSTIMSEEIGELYGITIYNFQGHEIQAADVTSEKDENIIVMKLPEGIYIIKSPKGDRKVYSYGKQ